MNYAELQLMLLTMTNKVAAGNKDMKRASFAIKADARAKYKDIKACY